MSSPSESRPASPSSDGHEPVNDIDDRAGASVAKPIADMDDDLSDNDSILSDVDEAQFEDFDPANVTIDRPTIPVDEGNVKLLGRHKRKRDGEQGDEEGGKRKKKEGKRERSRKSKKKNDDDDDDFSGGQEVEGKRIRKKKSGAEGGSGARREKTRTRKATPEDEESLDPEESRLCPTLIPFFLRATNMFNSGRRRALDRAMDAALKNPSKRRRRADGIVRLVDSTFCLDTYLTTNRILLR